MSVWDSATFLEDALAFNRLDDIGVTLRAFFYSDFCKVSLALAGASFAPPNPLLVTFLVESAVLVPVDGV